MVENFKTTKMSFSLEHDEKFCEMFYDLKDKTTKEGGENNNILTETLIECMNQNGIKDMLDKLPDVRKSNKGKLHKTQTIVINLAEVRKNNPKLYNNIGKTILLASNKNTLNYTRDYVYKCILKYGVSNAHAKFCNELKEVISKKENDFFEKYKLE